MSTRTLQRALLGLVAAGLVVPTSGCDTAKRHQEPRRIFLVTVDTLRADHLGSYGYERATSPTIDRLAREGVRFERAIAQWPLTGPSFASLMSGHYPRTTGAVNRPHVSPPDGFELLPEFLRGRGYTTAAVVSNRVLARKAGWDRGFDEYHETWAGAEGPLREPAELKSWLTAPRVNELALPLLQRHRDTERLFVWLHYSDPHVPYTLPPGFDNPFTGGDPTPAPELAPSQTVEGLETLGDYVANYDANILLADRSIGAALERAGELGLLEDALVVFTADHGESLGEHDYYFRHGRYPYNPSSRVPLVFHRPGQLPAGAEVQRPVELVDLFPTVRELVDPDGEPADLPGKSLVAALSGTELPRDLAFTESRQGRTHFVAAQDEEWKVVLRTRREAREEPIVAEEIYHLAEDPLEERDLSRRDPAGPAELRRSLARWMATTVEGDVGEVPEPDEEMRQALEALGYLDVDD